MIKEKNLIFRNLQPIHVAKENENICSIEVKAGNDIIHERLVEDILDNGKTRSLRISHQ